jgi:rhodanese-related sulfurtransferase
MTRTNWQREAGRALLIVFFWSLAAAAVNTVSPNRIAWVGPWPSTFGTDTASVPPSYEEDDPPILRLDAAIALFQTKDVVFIDARDPEDFVLGHIPGALLLPFDYYDDYAGAVLAEVDRDREVVTYCGGADCELSLYLARQLRNEGFTKIRIFFGGADAWEEAGLPLEEESP